VKEFQFRRNHFFR